MMLSFTFDIFIEISFPINYIFSDIGMNSTIVVTWRFSTNLESGTIKKL
jgi:hypothetical protein